MRWLTLLVLLVSLGSGCGGAPKIELCQIDGSATRRAMDCATERLSHGYSRTAESTEGYICLHPTQAQAFFIACRDREPVTVDFCNVDGKNAILYCGGIRDGNDHYYSLTWVAAKDYICTNPRHFRIYIDWCYR